jgi:hypothetical protein
MAVTDASRFVGGTIANELNNVFAAGLGCGIFVSYVGNVKTGLSKLADSVLDFHFCVQFVGRRGGFHTNHHTDHFYSFNI